MSSLERPLVALDAERRRRAVRVDADGKLEINSASLASALGDVENAIADLSGLIGSYPTSEGGATLVAETTNVETAGAASFTTQYDTEGVERISLVAQFSKNPSDPDFSAGAGLDVQVSMDGAAFYSIARLIPTLVVADEYTVSWADQLIAGMKAIRMMNVTGLELENFQTLYWHVAFIAPHEAAEPGGGGTGGGGTGGGGTGP